MTEIAEDAALTPDEILRFGPVVESQVWHPIWLQESRAPIAVAAGRPKLGKVFDDNGVGKAVVIRPCVSRGKRVRGLAPIYTPAMLEANASVFSGWPMFQDHLDPRIAGALAKRGRSVKDLGGQVLKSYWGREFVHEDDDTYGYKPGATLAEIWATPLVRSTVGENPNLLHTSINAWPTGGRPGTMWNTKGMVIEGIRSQPQGSLDFVPRGGAGGRLLLAEGEWPEPAWEEDDVALVVTLAEALYSADQMEFDLKNATPEQLREHVREHAPHLAPALAQAPTPPAPTPTPTPPAATPSSTTLTEDDVQRRIDAALQEHDSGREDREREIEESAQAMLREREEQRLLSEKARARIESSSLPDAWKAQLIERYTLAPSGPPPALLVESDQTDDQGNALSALAVVEARVDADIDRSLDLIAEAQGKPRVKGEGGRDPKADGERLTERETVPYWREAAVSMGLAESEDEALDIYGDGPEREKKKDDD